MERIRTLSELPFRINFLFAGKILTILKILGEHKSDEVGERRIVVTLVVHH